MTDVEDGPFGRILQRSANLKAETQNELKQRLDMYRMIVGQLQYDGQPLLAQQVGLAINCELPCPASDALFQSFRQHRYSEDGSRVTKAVNVDGEDVNADDFAAHQRLRQIDMEFETDDDLANPASEPGMAYRTIYVTSHKNACRSGAFGPAASRLCATGSADASIKLLDIDRMLAKADIGGTTPGGDDDAPLSHPVIRTLYDHAEEVTSLAFHPRVDKPLLISGSRDRTVKVFDYGKVATRRATRSLAESAGISAVSIHPAGDHMLVAVDDSRAPVVRLYDLETGQSFVSTVPGQHQTDAVTSVDWTSDGKLFASGAMDGSIFFWDGISAQTVNQLSRAHGGSPVASVKFSKNGKYLLTSAKDSTVRLWQVATGRCLVTYTGAGATGKQEFMAQATFNHTEDYVLYPDEATTSLCTWDARSAGRKQLLSLSHNAPVRRLLHHDEAGHMLTCSDDFRARFWSDCSLLNCGSSSGSAAVSRSKA